MRPDTARCAEPSRRGRHCEGRAKSSCNPGARMAMGRPFLTNRVMIEAGAIARAGTGRRPVRLISARIPAKMGPGTYAVTLILQAGGCEQGRAVTIRAHGPCSRGEMPQRGALESLSAIVFGDADGRIWRLSAWGWMPACLSAARRVRTVESTVEAQDDSAVRALN